MRKVKSKTLKEVLSNTHYEGCTFYVDAINGVKNTLFDNCSFRDRDVFAVECEAIHLKHCNMHIFTFENIRDLTIEGCAAESCEINASKLVKPLNADYPFTGGIKSLKLTQCSLLENYAKNGLTSIKKLVIEDSVEFGLLNAITHLPSLEVLGIRRVKIDTIPNNFWEWLKSDACKIEELVLECINISEFPAQIGDLVRLKKLEFTYNNITSIPNSIFKLRNLEELVVSVNKLSELPEGIGQLTKLKKLDVRANCLVTLPQSIGDLDNLRELNITHNDFTHLPSGFVKVSPKKCSIKHDETATFYGHVLDATKELATQVEKQYDALYQSESESLSQKGWALDKNGSRIYKVVKKII